MADICRKNTENVIQMHTPSVRDIAMKTLTLNCNHCAAPLEVDSAAKYVTCAFCNCQLEIQSTGSSFSTRVLDQLVTNTTHIRNDVAALRRRLEIRELDFRWERQSRVLADFDENGVESHPSPNAVIGKAIALIVGCLLFTWYTQVWFLFGFSLVIIALKSGYDYTKAIDYLEAQRGYLKKRQKLVAKEQDETESLAS